MTPKVTAWERRRPPAACCPEGVRELLQEAASAVEGHKFALHFLVTEWEQVVDAWQLDGWEAYRDVARLGRKTPRYSQRRSLSLNVLSAAMFGVCASFASN